MCLKLLKIYAPCILLAMVYPSFYLCAQGVYINSGANVIVTGAASLVINNAAFSNSGNFSAANGTVTFTGTAAADNTFIAGNSNTAFYNLIINKTGGGVKLMQHCSVSNIVFMTNHNLDLNGFDVNLGSTGNMSGEKETSYIFGQLGGSVIRSISLNAPSAVNPGNMGLEITSASNLGATVIKRSHRQQVTASGHSINRFFDVFAANNSDLNASVKFYYLNAELAGITESELEIWGSANSGGNWKLRNRDAEDMTANFVSKDNVSQLDRVTLASAVNSPLPVSLLYFSGQLENNRSKLSWSTSAEKGNDHFEVQRSADARNFQAIATIAGAGTSNTSHHYTYLDAEPFSNIMYYRLKQVNKDGSFIFSKIISVNINVLYNNRLAQVYPNPTMGPVSILFTSNMARQVTIEVTDIKGRIISNKVVDAAKGLNQVNHNMVMLAQGTYFLRIIGIDNKAFKIFKY